MGANATTFVPAYVSGDVLTAANLSVTNSGIPVFADSTARDAAFGGTGEKTLAEGQYAYLESTNATQFYDGAAWQPVSAGGMTLISTTTLTGASVSLSAIPQTYKNLQLIVRNFLPSVDNAGFCVRVNGDSGANRHFSASLMTGTSAFNGTFWDANSIGQDNAVTQSLGVWDIYDYTNTVTWKMARNQFGNNNAVTTTSVSYELSLHYYNQIDAITSLTLITRSGNFTSGTVLLYGIS